MPATRFEPQVTKAHVSGVPTTPASEGPYSNVPLLAVAKLDKQAERSGLEAKYQSDHKPGLGTCIPVRPGGTGHWRHQDIQVSSGRDHGLSVCARARVCVCKSLARRQLETRGCKGELLGRLCVWPYWGSMVCTGDGGTRVCEGWTCSWSWPTLCLHIKHYLCKQIEKYQRLFLGTELNHSNCKVRITLVVSWVCANKHS